MKRFLIFLLMVATIATVPSANTQVANNSRDWKFWQYEHLKSLDPWGDSDGDTRDAVAVYVKEDTNVFHFRIDLMDLRSDSSLNVYFAIDYKTGGNNLITIWQRPIVSHNRRDRASQNQHPESQQPELEPSGKKSRGNRGTIGNECVNRLAQYPSPSNRKLSRRFPQ